MIPGLRIEFAFDPKATWKNFDGSGILWTNLAHLLRDFTVSYGRQFEWQRMDPARMAMSLSNQDRSLDPDLLPAVYGSATVSRCDADIPVRIVATWGGVDYYLFTGFTTDWKTETHDIFGEVATISATDGFQYLGTDNITGSFVEELAGARITRVLDAISWSSTARDIDTGAATHPETTLEKVAPLDHLMQAIEAERGAFYFNGQGYAVFRDRDTIFRDAYRIPKYIFGGPGGLPYHEPISFTRSKSTVWNHAIANIEGGADQTGEDVGSVNQRGRKSYSGLKNLLLTSDEDAKDIADYITVFFSDPATRISPVVLRPAVSVLDYDDLDALWEPILNIELLDLIQIQKHWADAGTIGSKNANVESIEHKYDAKARTWQTTLSVSPSTGFTPWILGDSVRGVLNSTTYLGY